MGAAALEIEKKIEVSGRRYHWPERPSVVVCFDGYDPEYIDAASHSGVIPTLDRIIATGFCAVAGVAAITVKDKLRKALGRGVDGINFSAQKRVALGAPRIDHDLSQLAAERLRSHGGLAERNVPLLVSEPVSDRFIELTSGTLQNYDIFDFALTAVKAG